MGADALMPVLLPHPGRVFFARTFDQCLLTVLRTSLLNLIEKLIAMNFADRLKQLPSASHLAALQLLGPDGQVLATIENKPGQTGSLVVYAALAALYGGQITPAAASLGLEWYAEHVADARAFAGKHPNIDRLLDWAQGSESFAVRTVTA